MESNFWSHINKVLQVGVIIVIMFITNLFFFIFSVMSLLFLTPVCIASALNMSKSILNKNYDDLLINYFKFIKRNAVKSFKVALPFMLTLVIVVSNILYLNDVLLPFTNNFVLSVIFLLQLLVAFEVFNIMMLTLIQVTINPNKPAKVMYRDAFLVGNRYFFRMIISSSVFIIVFMLGYNVNILFFLISTTLVFFLYYGSFSLIIKKHFDQACQLISQ